MTAHTDSSLLGAAAPQETASQSLEAPSRPPAAPRDVAEPERRLADIVERHHGLVWRALRRFGVPERDVEDAAQQVFLTFAAELAALGPGKEVAYLLAVAVRVAANARRKVQRSPEVLGEDLEAVPALGTPEALLGEKQLRQELDRGLSTLPLEPRAVFVLYELEGFTLPEIAEALSLPLGTATSRLRRARLAFESWVTQRQVGGVR